MLAQGIETATLCYLAGAIVDIKETGDWNDLLIRNLDEIKGDDIFHASFSNYVI